MSFVFRIRACSAKEQTETVSELAELAAEVKEQSNFCSSC